MTASTLTTLNNRIDEILALMYNHTEMSDKEATAIEAELAYYVNLLEKGFTYARKNELGLKLIKGGVK